MKRNSRPTGLTQCSFQPHMKSYSQMQGDLLLDPMQHVYRLDVYSYRQHANKHCFWTPNTAASFRIRCNTSINSMCLLTNVTQTKTAFGLQIRQHVSGSNVTRLSVRRVSPPTACKQVLFPGSKHGDMRACNSLHQPKNYSNPSIPHYLVDDLGTV